MTFLTRRAAVLTSLAAATLPNLTFAHAYALPDRFLPQLVNTYRTDWVPGSVHVVPDDFFLYFMLEDGMAIRYGVGVGREGLYEAGSFNVARKAEWPRWRPTNAMIRREPEKYARFADGVPGGLAIHWEQEHYIFMMMMDGILTCASTEQTSHGQSDLPFQMDVRD